MHHDFAWRMMFSLAIAVLMLAILFVRNEDTPVWVMIVYPAVGALLANVASRTSQRVEEIAWIESSTIAAACILILAILVNLLVIEQQLHLIANEGGRHRSFFERYAVVVLQGIAVLLWLALSRRLARMREKDADKRKPKNGPDSGQRDGNSA